MTAVERSPRAALSGADAYLHVLHALMLRDMRTRFAGSYWGWGVAVFWPVAHMLVVAGFLALRDLPSPMGESTMIFVASGAVPTLVFQYISREVMKGVLANRPLTYYPQVKGLDVMIARILVEIVGGFAGLVAICLVLVACGLDPRPMDLPTALCGYVAAIVLGIGVGTINAGIVVVFPGWILGYAVFGILLYIASGVAFMPCYMPEQIYAALKWNPLTQVVEWVRLGYDPSLPVEVDRLYVTLWAGCSLALGLLFERFVARKRA